MFDLITAFHKRLAKGKLCSEIIRINEQTGTLTDPCEPATATNSTDAKQGVTVRFSRPKVDLSNYPDLPLSERICTQISGGIKRGEVL